MSDMTPSDAIRIAHEICCEALDRIATHFDPRYKWTIIGRRADDVEADILTTSDTIPELVKLLERREAGEVRGDISQAEIDRAIADLDRDIADPERKNGEKP